MDQRLFVENLHVQRESLGLPASDKPTHHAVPPKRSFSASQSSVQAIECPRDLWRNTRLMWNMIVAKQFLYDLPRSHIRDLRAPKRAHYVPYLHILLLWCSYEGTKALRIIHPNRDLRTSCFQVFVQHGPLGNPALILAVMSSYSAFTTLNPFTDEATFAHGFFLYISTRTHRDCMISCGNSHPLRNQVDVCHLSTVSTYFR